MTAYCRYGDTARQVEGAPFRCRPNKRATCGVASGPSLLSSQLCSVVVVVVGKGGGVNIRQAGAAGGAVDASRSCLKYAPVGPYAASNTCLLAPFVLQILEADPASCELLAELLLPHLRSYMVEDDTALPPLLLHKCTQLIQVRQPCNWLSHSSSESHSAPIPQVFIHSTWPSEHPVLSVHMSARHNMQTVCYVRSVACGLQGEAVLVEPLPALLSCVYRLSNAAAQQAAAAADLNKGPGSLEASENWMGGDDDGNQEQQEQSTSAILKVASFVQQLPVHAAALHCCSNRGVNIQESHACCMSQQTTLT